MATPYLRQDEVTFTPASRQLHLPLLYLKLYTEGRLGKMRSLSGQKPVAVVQAAIGFPAKDGQISFTGEAR